VIGSLLRGTISRAVAVFYRLDRRGSPVPPGPAVLVANHPNSLLDPLVLFRTAGRPSRPLARAPLFDRPLIGWLIRAVGGIPIYRREDDPAQMVRNRDALRAAVDALRSGDAVQIFPEGRTHSDPSISPLRTGAARIALAAEADAGWRLGVVIVPIGLTYARKAVFRGHAVAVYGKPFPVSTYRPRFERDEQAAVRALTAEIDRRLRALTLDLTRLEDAELVDAAERLWTLEKGLRTSRQRVRLGERLPRLQAFARGLAWLRVHDPDRHRRIEVAVRGYHRRMRVLGAGEGDVPSRFRFLPMLRWVATRAMPVTLLSPLALVATAAWGAPYVLVGRTVDRMVGRRGLPVEVVATYKLGAALLAYPLFLTLWTGLAAWLAGWRVAIVVAVTLTVIGLVAVRWLDVARDVVQDLRLFLRLAGPGSRTARARRVARTRVAAERRAITAEFDAIRELMGAGHASPDGGAPAGVNSSGSSSRRKR